MKRFLIFSLFIFTAMSVRAEEKQSEEDDATEELCFVSERIYKAKQEIQQEKLIAKESGAANLTALNDAGRKVVKNQQEAKKQMAQFKKKYKHEFDLTRCSFLDEIDQGDINKLSKKDKSHTDTK